MTIERNNQFFNKSKVFLENQVIIYSLARVAQSVERSAVNRKVGGSNPPVSEFLFLKIIIFYTQIEC